MGFIITTLFLVGLIWFAFNVIPKKLDAWDREHSLRWLRVGVGGLAAFLLAVHVVTSFIMIVPQGHARAGTIFGTLDQHVYRAGLQPVNPFETFEDYSIQRQAIEFQAGDTQHNGDDLLAQSSDKVPLTIDATFGVQINPASLPWLLANLGDQDTIINTLINPTCRQAVRVGTAGVTMDAAITSGRGQLAEAMRANCESETVATLVGMGLDRGRAQHAFTFLPVQLRRVEPPPAVMAAQADRQAAQIGFERAGFIVETEQRLVAAAQARGQSLQQLAASAPHGWTARDIADVTQADALRIQANAIQQAVQGGHVPIIVTNGGGTTVQVPQGR